MILTMLSESLVGLADTLIVSQLGSVAVAAVGVGTQILSGVSAAMMAVSTGTLALVARSVGAGQPREARLVLGQSIVAALVLTLATLLPVWVWAAPLVGAFRVAPEVIEPGADFVRFIILSVPGAAVVFTIGAGLRGAGDTRTPLALGLLINALNIAGNYVLVFGKLGLPALGVRGSAIATALAFTIGAVAGLAWLRRGGLRLTLAWRDLRPEFATIRRVLAIGYPAAAEHLLMQVGFFIYLVFAARYGTDAMAAYFIGVRILALSFLPGFGFSTAAAALVGQNLGAGAPLRAARAGWISTWMAIALMSLAGMLAFALAEPIARLFGAEPAVVEGTVSFLHMLALAQPLMAIDFTLGGALRGAGDTRFPLLTVIVAFFGCRLGYAFVASSVLHASLPWLWSALIGDYVARAAMKAWRWHEGAWQRIEI